MIPKSAFLMLPVMALAFYIAFMPHQGYPYPLHIDEWAHLAYAEALLRAGSTTFTEPILGNSTIGLSSNLEAGFHVFWGVFHQVSGISWSTIFRYFPGVILAITVLSAYVMGQRQGFGLGASFFAALVPTSVGILGPAFLVPVAMGLIFIAIAIFVAFNFSSAGSYLVLFLFTCFLLTIHAPSAICLVIILVPYILLNLKGNFKHSLGMGLALAVPFLAPFPWIFGMLLPTAQGLLAPQALPEYVAFPQVIKAYGYLPVGLCLLGTLALAIRGGKRDYGLVLGLLALLAVLVTFFTLHYGIAIMYERGLMFMMLVLGMVAGAGLTAVKGLRLPGALASRAGFSAISRYLGWGLCLVLAGVTLYIAIPERQSASYYHMISETEYQSFVWIKENVGEEYGKAILDPWKATPFTAVTGKTVYTRIFTAPTDSDEAASRFLAEGCRDTAFLKAKGISIVYTGGECLNPDLTRVHEDVYLLKK